MSAESCIKIMILENKIANKKFIPIVQKIVSIDPHCNSHVHIHLAKKTKCEKKNR